MRLARVGVPVYCPETLEEVRVINRSERQIIDAEALARLNRLGGDELVCRMIDLFLPHAENTIARARASLAAGELPGVHRAVHSLRSSAGNLGARELETLSGLLENLPLDSDQMAFRHLLAQLEDAFARARIHLLKERELSGAARKTIAVVEDNPDSRELVSVILSGRYHVRSYASGQEALDGIRAGRPDLILMDVSLPGMDGPDVVKNIRDDAALRDIPIVAFTAHSLSGDRECLLEGGFDDYVRKPVVEEQTLFDTIERWLKRPDRTS